MLSVAVPSLISFCSVVFSARIHRQIKTPSGDSIGAVMERSHDTGIANNLLLRQLSPATRPANGEELHVASHEPPSVPQDDPAAG